jgi:hypothetical protein
MKQFKTTLGNLRNGELLPDWKDDWEGFSDDTSVTVYQDGSMKVGNRCLLPLPFESYGNTPPQGWENLPWKEPNG